MTKLTFRLMALQQIASFQLNTYIEEPLVISDHVSNDRKLLIDRGIVHRTGLVEMTEK